MRLLKIEQLCEPGSGLINEDAAGHNDFGAWVIDGATGLSGRTLTPSPTDSHWYSQWWQRYFHRHLDDGQPLSMLCAEGIARVAREYHDQWPEATPEDYPSAAGALARFSGDHLEYQIFGDAVLILRDEQGVQVIRDTSLNRLDDHVLSRMHRLMNVEGHSHAQARHHLLPQLKRNRALKNRPEGYWTLEFSVAAAQHGLQGRYRPSGRMQALLLTDGLSILLDSFQYCTAEELLDWVAGQGLRPVYERVRQLESSDPEMQAWARFKHSDDASGLFFEACLH